MANYSEESVLSDCKLLEKLKISSEYLENNYLDLSDSALKDEMTSDEEVSDIGDSNCNGLNSNSANVFFNNSGNESTNELNVPLSMNSEVINESNKQDAFLSPSVLSLNSPTNQQSSNRDPTIIDKNLNSLSPSPLTVKSFGPSIDRQRGGVDRSQNYYKIKRVPSTANPKYKIPNLPKTQRSKSQPVIHSKYNNYDRRNSSPSELLSSNNQQSRNFKYNSSDISSFIPANQSFQQMQSNYTNNPQQQQQIIYLQIPQPSPNLLSDPQGLQQQISSQLQLLVPQIYNQLLNQINKSTADQGNLNTVKVSLNQNEMKSFDSESLVKNCNEDAYLNSSSFLIEESPSQRVMNQVLQQNLSNQSLSKSSSTLQNKRQKTNHQRSQQQKTPTTTTEPVISEKDGLNSHYIQLNDFCQILQHIPTHILQQSQSKSELSYIEIQHIPGFPNMKIPLTQELILQCQQLQQQFREPGTAVPYQPRLETILEESHSVKHLSISRFPKTKIIACILTVLCVVVVILLAGDKTVAVAIIAAIFVLFLLGSTFYLYTNSTKSELSESLGQGESQRLQINSITNCNKPSMV